MSSTSGKDVQFGAPIRGRESSSRPSAGRTCEESGCATVLSTYNAGAPPAGQVSMSGVPGLAEVEKAGVGAFLR